MNSDLNLIPEEFRKLSLDDREVVLPFDETLRVLAYWRESNIACLGWEAWVLLPDGLKTGLVSTSGKPEVWEATFERNSDESWPQFVKRSADGCSATIRDTQDRWAKKPDKAGRELYYCLTPDNLTS